MTGRERDPGRPRGMEHTDPMQSHRDDHRSDGDDPLDLLAGDIAAAEVLGLSVAHVPRPGLRGEVLAAAFAARGPDAAGAGGVVAAPTEALARTIADVRSLVASMDPADATRITVEGWTIAGLLGHLTAIEEHFGATLGWWPEAGQVADEHDHLAMTVPAVRVAESLPYEEVRSCWEDTSDRVVARLGSLEDRLAERVDFHGFDFSIRSLLIARTFEVWTHGEDICRALGRPPVVLDTARLRMMTAAAVGALPIGMLLTGAAPRGRSVRVVLTGEGGGAWVQALELGAPPGDPAATIVVDAVEFCRVAAKRLVADDVELSIVGDADLAAEALSAVAVFAA